MKEKIKQKGFSKIISVFIGLVVIGGFIVWTNYGTLHPCGILKKEVRNILEREIKKTDDLSKGLLALFGESLINYAIDGLSPSQCISRMITIKFGSKEEINKVLESDSNRLFFK